ncbi:hypothetical protein PV10_07282 [Exophiala mesophila]|uniref:DAGKc domain-containing protein n=1 Tax=Exophiala mesophila TaxID=212818 RepID=A0A0D1Z7K0_EXOME|nr:uncharacterized protein PV10_07282 [Exophiala mesophila]KIV89924.1 hypothetical protein PV10_07282 [Exophiala mesophila]
MGIEVTRVLPPHLQPDHEIHVIVSILSGRQKAQEYYDETLKPWLDDHKLQYATHTTKSAQTIIELTKSLILPNATQGVKQTLILLSGDGGIIDIVNTLNTELLRRKNDHQTRAGYTTPVVALVPMGTANALAWSSKVAQDPLGVLLKGSPKALPAFQVSLSQGSRLVTNEGQSREIITSTQGQDIVVYGAVVASWGLHASLVAMSDTAEYRKHGLERFQMAAQELAKDLHIYKGKIKWRKAGGEWVQIPGSEHAYLLSIMVSNLEEHFQISPHSKPLDGSLRLLHIGPEPVSEIMRILGLAYQAGAHANDSKLSYREIDSMRIEFEEDDELWRMVCVDGKIIAIEEGGWMEVKRLSGTGIEAGKVVDLVC